MEQEDDRILRLQAALDGELDAEAMLAFERACAADPALAAEFAQFKALDAALRAAAPIEPAPERLRRKIEALAAPTASSVPPSSRPAWMSTRKKFDFSRLSTPGALAASLLVGVMIGHGFDGPRNIAPEPQAALVDAFMRANVGGQQIAIESSDRHVVKPWLAQRVALAAAAPDLAAENFVLAGARVEATDGKIAPTLVYRRREHRVELTEFPSDGRGATTPEFSARDGFAVARWRDDARAYVAVTDLPQAELAEFIALFQARILREREAAAPSSK